LGGATRGENYFHVNYIYVEKKIFKIFSTRTTRPEKCKFTWKLPNIVFNQVCYNHCQQGFDGATTGKTIFTCVYKSSSDALSHE
jgi:hypothetical protein